MVKKEKFVINQKLKKELENKTILVTGGAGSIGIALIKFLLKYPVKSIRALDIDEHGLFRLGRETKDIRLRLLLGDLQNKERIMMAGKNVDIVIHTAAIKNIEISEYNPMETIETNVIGTMNLVKMAMEYKPKKFLNISTDKATEPTTLYGLTKQMGEKITSWAGVHLDGTKFSTIRFGNIIETRGNVFEVWEEESKKGLPLSITNPEMKRYFFHVDETVDFIMKILLIMKKGEIFVPKMKSYKIVDLANKVSKNHKQIGLRRGEKMEEVLISDREKEISKETKDFFIIPPQ